MVYQIKDWNKYFENSRSREVDRCSFVCVPNKQHGIGFTYILSQEEGAAILGVWYLIVEACSMHHRPRSGWLTDNGTKSGKPWTPKILALRWRRTESEIILALETLSSIDVGWLNAYELSTKCRSAAGKVRRKGREGKGIEGKGKENSVSSALQNSAKPIPSNFYLEYPCTGKEKAYYLTNAQVTEWQQAYEALDIATECTKALVWIKANRKKTARGMPRFLVTWFNRAVGFQGGKSPFQNESKRGRAATESEIDAQERRLANGEGF